MSNQNTIDYHFKSTQSFSHMIGCITALIVDYIRSPFPDSYFKTIRLTTEVPYNERMRLRREVAKQPRPALIIEPKFDISDDTKFQPNSEFDYLIPSESANSNNWNLLDIGAPFLVNPEGKYELYNKVARYKISFTVNFIFDSEIQQMQAQEHIRQNIRHQIPYPLNRFVENNIPQNFMEAVAIMEGMDINSDTFMERVNQLSNVPISHRIRPGSGNKEFFCLRQSNLQVLFTSLPSFNGFERRGKMITSSSFTETIEVEFPANSSYFLRANTDVSANVDMSESVILSQSVVSPVSTTTYLPESPLFNNFENGWKKVVQMNVQFDTADVDSIEISKYIPEQIQQLVSYHVSQKMQINFLQCKVSEGMNRLDDTRVSFDASTLTVSVSNTDAFKSYIVAVYVDNEYSNTLRTSISAYDEFPGNK